MFEIKVKLKFRNLESEIDLSLENLNDLKDQSFTNNILTLSSNLTTCKF